MIKLIFKVLLSLIPLCSFAQPVELEGIWKSDKDKTFSWNKEHRNFKDKELDILVQIAGHEYLVISKNTYCSYIEPHQINGQYRDPLSPPIASYVVKEKNEFGFVLTLFEKTKNEKSENRGIIMVIFDTATSFYVVPLFANSGDFSEFRIFFKKVEKPKGANFCGLKKQQKNNLSN